MNTQVGVLGSRYEMGHYMGLAIPIIAMSDTYTGFAVANTSDQSITVELILLSINGGELQRRNMVLNGGEQTAHFIHELFPLIDFDNFHGSLEIRTENEGMVGLALLQSHGVLTSIPMIHIPDADPDHGTGPHM